MSKGSRARRNRGKKISVGPHRKPARVRVYDTTGEVTRTVHGSDIKTSEKVLGICALCMTDTTLLLSHIIPKWAFKWLKAEGGVIHNKPSGYASPRMQDGLKHYLLCEPCEIFLGNAENMLSQITSMQPNSGTSKLGITRSKQNIFLVTGKMRHLIQRALFGIALKYHFAPTSSHRIYSDKHVQDIRAAAINDFYPESSEPFGIKWFNGTISGANPRAYAGVALNRTRNGASTAIISAGGIDWFIQLTSADRHFVEQHEPWTITIASLESRAAWFDNWESGEVHVPNNLWGIRPEDNCPCGSPNTLGRCCDNGWLRLNRPPRDSMLK